MVAGDWGLPLLGAGTLHGSLWVRHFLQHLCRYVGYYCRATAGSEDAEMNLLGDSYAMGYFLYKHETIAAQPAERSGIGVVTGGLGGYSTEQDFIYLQRLLEWRDPSWVVVIFFCQ